jgi:hypothetical protein
MVLESRDWRFKEKEWKEVPKKVPGKLFFWRGTQNDYLWCGDSTKKQKHDEIPA